MRITTMPAAAAFALLSTALAGAQAGEICVRCTGPEQTYRCSVLGPDAPAEQRRLGFFCASRIAKDENHTACAAVRKEKQCLGARRSYVYDAAAGVPGPLADERPEDRAHEAGPEPEREGPPRTVVDLTRETARQTEESLEKAADRTVETSRTIGERVRDAAEGAAGAVEDATRSTIRCIGSLFDDC